MKTCSRVGKKRSPKPLPKAKFIPKNVWFIVYSYFNGIFANFCRFRKMFSDKIMYIITKMPGS